MSARDRILARLKAAAPQQPLPLPDVAGHFQQVRPVSTPQSRLAAFKAGIEAFHAEVHLTRNTDWPELLARLCREKGLNNLLHGADEALQAQLSARSDLPPLRCFDRSIDDWKRELFDSVDAAISIAHGAIAETGTLILWPGLKEPRSLSLVPPVHFVLLDASRIYDDLHQAMSAEHWSERLPTNLLLVSGPSKTADIQQTLAYGAHGPKELVVLVAG